MLSQNQTTRISAFPVRTFISKQERLSSLRLPTRSVPAQAAAARAPTTRLAGAKGFWSHHLPVSGILTQSGLFEVTEAAVAQMVSPELGQPTSAHKGMSGTPRKI